jgi:hypothetical protein
MFHSKTRSIIIPQYEHGRLAGILAQHWGNEQFGRPVLNFASFVQGVALHDWHYGFGDNLPIQGANEADWLAMTRRGLELRFDDPITDIVAKLHLRRLLSSAESPERQAMMAQLDDYVDGRLPETGFGRAEFEWADGITRFCDMAAFDFAFEVPCERTVTVGNRVNGPKETAVAYQIKANGDVIIDPWPFAVPFISGSIMGFQTEGYPEKL